MSVRPSFVRVGFRRIGSTSAAGGAITLVQGSPSIDVSGGSGPTVTVSAKDNGITNAKLAQAPANTLKGNNTAGLANEADLTVGDVTTLLGLGTAAFQPTSAFDVAGAAAAAQAASQPLDSDLTAIAALTTTTYGRALLTLANQAALQAAAGLGTAAFQPASAFDASGAAAAAQAASQPLDSDLTAIAALTTTAYGRNLLILANQAALTAGIAVATTGLSGAMSTADKTKLDSELVLIDTATLAAQTVYTSPTWAANLYRELQFRFTNHLGSATGVITLTGLTAAYSSAFFTTDGSSVLSAASAAWQATPNAPGFWAGNIICVNDGNPRAYEATAWLGTVPYHQRHAGICNDTTHGVTGLVATFNAAVSGTFVLRGVPT